MRVLLVEDNIDFAKQIEKSIGTLNDCEVIWARSRDSALQHLSENTFDLILLDRRIPSGDDVLDDHIDHGWRIFQAVREFSPGTSVWFVTGSEDADFAAELANEHGRIEDIHSRKAPEQMYRVFWKKGMDVCLNRLREFYNHLSDVDRIAIRLEAGLTLAPEHERAVKLFGRRYNGVAVDVSALNGGLSDSRVLKVVVRNAADAALTTAAAKVSKLASINDEAARYNSDVVRLTPGGYPSLSFKVEAGAANSGGLFYGMVGNNVESLFERLSTGHVDVSHVPEHLRAITQPWVDGKAAVKVTIGHIRRRLIGDAALHEVQDLLEGIDITGIEALTVSAAQCCQHNDMHCANVVFSNQGLGMLIDFGDTGQSFSCRDPVTLELSTIFHSQHAILPAGWPTEEAMSHWGDLDQFVVGCEFSPFIIACRQWALDVAASPQEVIALAYSYALRQLKYDDTDKTLARALIKSCIANLTSHV